MSWDYDPFMRKYMDSSAPDDMKKRITDYYKGGKMYDIYVNYDTPKPVILAIDRLTKETYDQIEDKENFHRRRTNIDYYCQYPHQDWKDAIQEYEIWNKIYMDYSEERIFKTYYLPKIDFSSIRPDIREKIEKMEKYQFYPLHMFCFHVVMFNYMTSKVEL